MNAPIPADESERIQALLATNEEIRKRLGESEQELRAAHDELETRVQKRTAELQAAEHEASESKNRYDLILASSGVAIYDIDRLTGEVFWGSGAERVLGLDPKTLNRASDEWLELVHPQDRNQVMRCIEGAITNGVSFEIQYRLRHGADHYRWIKDCGFAAHDAQGRGIRLLGMMQDMTQRKLAEDTMREQAMLLDQTQDAIMVCNLENCILYWNQTAHRLYGWTFGEALGRPVHELLLEGQYAHLPTAKATALKQGQWCGEPKVFTKAGKQMIVNSRWTMLRDHDGKPYAFLVADTDLTERKLLEAKFLRAQRLESVGAIASGIAHDLNNVFTPILMSAQLLGDDLDDATRASALGILKSSARRGSEMVKQVLTFARGLEAGPGLVQMKHLLDEMENIAHDTFPHNIRTEKNVPAERIQTSEPAAVKKEAPNGHGELLLIIDDESAMREILKTTLEAHDYDVLLAEEGAEALALYATHREKIALVVTDIAMPVLDGHATIRALRKINPQVKLIAVSGLLERGKLDQLPDAPPFIPKPFSTDKLLNTINNVLHPAKN